MFSVGQRVWLRSGQRSGIVLEISGDRVYIAQDNGAELDFAARDITAEQPGHAQPGSAGGARHAAILPPPRARGTAPLPQAAAPHGLRASDITPEHERVLAVIPVRVLQAVAALYARGNAGARFSSLDTAAKLNLVSSVTAVPYSMMREYSDRPGELGLLMGKGLADSNRQA